MHFACINSSAPYNRTRRAHIDLSAIATLTARPRKLSGALTKLSQCHMHAPLSAGEASAVPCRPRDRTLKLQQPVRGARTSLGSAALVSFDKTVASPTLRQELQRCGLGSGRFAVEAVLQGFARRGRCKWTCVGLVASHSCSLRAVTATLELVERFFAAASK